MTETLIPCPVCNGNKCSTCNNSGYVIKCTVEELEKVVVETYEAG